MAKDLDVSRYHPHFRHPALADPWEAALAAGPGAVMAVLTAVHGPGYRNPGAAMMIAPDGGVAGALTSGCIEADLILQAAEVRAEGMARRLRYGAGSPFIDLRLPCGGAIEVLLFRIDDAEVLARLARLRAARDAATLRITAAGRLDFWRAGATAAPDDLLITFRPPLRLVIFGAGAEATVFADMAQALGFEHVLISHEARSLATAWHLGCNARHLSSLPDAATVLTDDRCAALLFYHDHDHEPQIIRQLLDGPAFYIGAQGSRATQARRLARLTAMGVPGEALARLRGPIGLVPSSRDPRQLAISVLAEVTMLAGDDHLVVAPE